MATRQRVLIDLDLYLHLVRDVPQGERDQWEDEHRVALVWKAPCGECRGGVIHRGWRRGRSCQACHGAGLDPRRWTANVDIHEAEGDRFEL